MSDQTDRQIGVVHAVPEITKADVLELVADFIRDGLPRPISIALYMNPTEVLVNVEDVPAWCEALDLCLPEWVPGDVETGSLFATWPADTFADKAIRVTSNCPKPMEVCS